MASSSKKKLITEVEPELYDQMKAQATEEDRSVAAMIRHAIRTYLKDVGRDGR